MMLGLPIWKIATWFGIAAGAVAVVAAIVMLSTSRSYRIIDGRVSGVVGRMGTGKSLFVVSRVLVPVMRSLRNGRTPLSSTGRPIRRIITNSALAPPWPGIEVVQLVASDDTGIWDQLKALSFEFAVPADLSQCDSVDQAECTMHPYKREGDDGETAARDLDTRVATNCLVDRRVECWEQRLDALVWLDEMHLFASSDRMKTSVACRWVTSMLRKLNAEMWWASQSEMKVHKRLRDDSESIWQVGRYRGLWVAVVGTNLFRARAFDSALLGRATAKPFDTKWYRFSRRKKKLYNSFQVIVPDPDRVPELNRRLRAVDRQEVS